MRNPNKVWKLPLLVATVTLCVAALLGCEDVFDSGGGGGNGNGGGNGGDFTITDLAIGGGAVTGNLAEHGEYARFRLTPASGGIYNVLAEAINPPAQGIPGFLYMCSEEDCTEANADATLEIYGSTVAYTYEAPNATPVYFTVGGGPVGFWIEAQTVTAAPIALGTTTNLVLSQGDTYYSLNGVAGSTYVVTVESVTGQVDAQIGTAAHMGYGGRDAFYNLHDAVGRCRLEVTASDVGEGCYVVISADGPSEINLTVAPGGRISLNLGEVTATSFLYHLYDQYGWIEDGNASISTQVTSTYAYAGDVWVYIRIDETGDGFPSSPPFDDTGYYDKIAVSADTVVSLDDASIDDVVGEAVTVTGAAEVPDGSLLWCSWFPDIGDNRDPDGYMSKQSESRAQISDFFLSGDVTTTTNYQIVPTGDAARFALFCIADPNGNYGSSFQVESGDFTLTVPNLAVDGSGTAIDGSGFTEVD